MCIRDRLIHCSGIIPPADVSLRDAWRRVLETNVVAVAHLTDLLLPTLRQSVGLVVVINSGSGLNAYGDTGGYSGSKFALTSFADGLREAERGRVRVSSVHPGRIDTDMQRELQSLSLIHISMCIRDSYNHPKVAKFLVG